MEKGQAELHNFLLMYLRAHSFSDFSQTIIAGVSTWSFIHCILSSTVLFMFRNRDIYSFFSYNLFLLTTKALQVISLSNVEYTE